MLIKIIAIHRNRVNLHSDGEGPLQEGPSPNIHVIQRTETSHQQVSRPQWQLDTSIKFK